MDKLIQTFMFSIIVIFAVITMWTFFVEPMGDESKPTRKLLNIVMFTLLTLFIMFIIMIAIRR